MRYMTTNQRQNGHITDGALIDDINRHLLAELQDDARLSIAELGRRVGLSSPAVADRIQRLEQFGVIRGYHADIDPRALGLVLGAIVRVRPAPTGRRGARARRRRPDRRAGALRANDG